jgi:nucleoside-diphosphate-sugar epimerase
MSILASPSYHRTVLVTGGTGFLGAYIIKALVQKGYTVKAIKRAESKLPFYIPSAIFDKVEWVEGDILDVISLDDAMQGVDTVIHAAAKVSFQKSDIKALYQTNVEGTANVVNIALENNIRRFIHISSVAALGRTGDGQTVTEKKEWKDNKINTSYAISKHKAEMEVWRGMAEGLEVVVLNPSTILGFGDWNHSSSAIFKNVYNEFPYYTKGVNGFVDVEDVASVTVQLMESNISNEKFIINTDNWPFKKLLDTIAENLNKKKPYRLATPFMGKIAWRIEAIKALFSGSQPLLTKESSRVAQSQTYFDNSKILAALPGFSFTPLQQSIQKSCKQYVQIMQTLK